MHLLLPVSPRSAKPRLGGRNAEVVSGFRSDALVLLVDDDERLRSVLAELLMSYGMRVLQAADGQQACAQFAQHADDIELVLLDVTMPGWSGIETLRRLTEVRPDVRAILLSGYTEQDVGQRLASKDQVSFLHKPFHMHELVTAIDALLRDTKRSRV
jgi:two-component system cell cycle sensor histidine kinase/response regulator CckA